MNYKISVKLNSPVCIAKKMGVGNLVETLDFIPGKTIRGALADYYIKKNGVDSVNTPEFQKLFLSEEISYPNCYPESVSFSSSIIPSTACTCKYSKGFFNPPDEHGVLDLLLPLLKYELDKRIVENRYENCTECQAPMEKITGYYIREKETDFKLAGATKRLVTKIQISEFTGTAEAKKLFTMEVINENEIFSAGLNEKSFSEFSNKLGNVVVRIGSAKSRGMGEVEINFLKCEPNGYNKDLSERLKRLNLRAEEFTSNGCYFSVTLQSDMILLDSLLRYKSILSTEDLYNLPGITNEFKDLLNKFNLIRSWTSINPVIGWNSALKLPKEKELAICKGSVFLFGCNDKQMINQKLIEALEIVESQGLGERKNEGFGSLRICDEFHWEVDFK